MATTSNDAAPAEGKRDAIDLAVTVHQMEPVPPPFVSLRLRLLGLVALVLVPWLALVMYTQADERKVAIAHVNADAMRLIRIATSNQAAHIEAARELLTAFGRLPQLRTKGRAACQALLADMLTAYPLYLNFGLAEPDGDVSCSARAVRGSVNIADRPYFAQAVQTRRFAIGDYQIGRVTQLPQINYAYPMVDNAGKVEAVVFAAQSLSWLTMALSNVQFPDGAILVVTDRNGTVIARLPDAEGWIGRILPEPSVLATLSMQKDGGVFEATDAQGVDRLWAHAPLIAGFDLHATIGVSRSVALADINRRLVRNLLALGLVTLVALGAAWFGANFFILRQVDALVAATGKLASGDLGARARLVGGRSELALLAGAFNSMGATLEARARDLRIAEERMRVAEIELAVTRAHMDIARQIQRSLLPEDPLTLAGVRVAGRCIPAVEVGGDYFGYFPRGINGVDSFVGDVSGHGVGAALLMAEARTLFLSERQIAQSAARILSAVNKLLYEDLDRARSFMSAFCATFDAATRELSYANAGHPPALLLRADESSCTLLDADGILLGIRKDAEFSEVKVPLRAGDIVVFYTDGITETQNDADALFGIDRLARAVVTRRQQEPEMLIASVLAELSEFGGVRQRDDDLTIVVMKLTA